MSSSDVNTQSEPTALRNSPSAAFQSRWLTPGGMAISDLPSNRRTRPDDPRIELRRLVEAGSHGGIGRPEITRRRRVPGNESIGERARPDRARRLELFVKMRIGRAHDAVNRGASLQRLVLGFEDDAQAVLPAEPLEQEQRRPLGEPGDRARSGSPAFQ